MGKDLKKIQKQYNNIGDLNAIYEQQREKLLDKIKPTLNENAMKVLSKRYLKKDSDGNPIEKAEDLFFRVAENIAQADKI